MRALCLLILLAWVLPAHATPTPGTYPIDSRQSRIDLFTGRAGLLRHKGHMHSVSATRLRGTIEVQEDRSAAGYLVLSASELVVDAPEVRARRGGEFLKPISAQDAEATRKNMLSERLLHAARFPDIVVSMTIPDVQASSPVFNLDIIVRGRAFRKVVRGGSLQVIDDRVIATADFHLSHRDLGLKPFSAVYGMLRVARRIEFSVEVHARRQQ
ncbi:hypothetical protein MNKW57_00890 [Biformimicrobium ophioploci]|uniref:Lipid/polyisoprenoid-binding YceI-like domain-containing protein n=1 Tax=Biformimicrobium ophioploci TaxID=3036711 RepID=A0ABQ6LUL4_9GAMM|nr:hypothetical protein MNKW57_00890 [Microbulbifer sp. NKW57]